MKIVLDAMGGDYAPVEVVKGAALAVAENKDIEVVLIGREAEMKAAIAAHAPGLQCELVHADEVITMEESAAVSVRKKRNSSIVKGIELVKKGQAQAFVSAGNTGAVACAATLSLGLIDGVDRPGIGICIPTLKGVSFMIDVGANIEPKPNHILQYAAMAEVYSTQILGKTAPNVGLLNIGEEASKGTEFMRDTLALLQEKFPNFVGNAEAKMLYSGEFDCIVCDGMIGNIALKVSQSVVKTATTMAKTFVKKDPLAMLGALLMSGALKKLKKRMDSSEYGGAPLLGVDGVVIIAHGTSNAVAIKNALRVAYTEVTHDINDKIKSRVASLAVA
jgi:glycerol-3-phosphate acyltransferase PlsX